MSNLPFNRTVVHNDIIGSDHFPIETTLTVQKRPKQDAKKFISRWKLKKLSDSEV